MPSRAARSGTCLSTTCTSDPRVTEHGWLGDVTGLTTSLDAANRKLVQMRRTATNLGLPARLGSSSQGAR